MIKKHDFTFIYFDLTKKINLAVLGLNKNIDFKNHYVK